MFQRTTAINQLLTLNKRIRIVQGGTWAGKTYGIIAILIDFAIKNKGRRIGVVAETIPAVKGGALADFIKIMYSTGRWIDDHYNGTDRLYRFSNGSTIQFTAFDTIGKAQAAGKWTDIFLNEAYYIHFDIADTLMSRVSDNIWMDFNPRSEFWAHEELLHRPDACFLKLLPVHNEALPENVKLDHEIKREKAKTSEYWANWCRVFLDGEIGRMMGVIFDNWEYGTFDDSIGYGFGLDFGFNDPDAMVKGAIDDKNMIIYLHQCFYENGLSPDQLAGRINAYAQAYDLIVADWADARMVAELSKRFNIKKAYKHAGSRADGIKLMQNYKLIITKESQMLAKELRGYMWADKKSGTPVGESDHLIDAARYFITFLLWQKTRQEAMRRRN